MDRLHQYPMARFLFPFIGGILFSTFFSTPIIFWLIFLAVIFLSLLLWFFAFDKHKTYRSRWINGLLITVFFFNLGIITFWYSSPLNHKKHYSQFDESSIYLIEIKSAFTETAKTYKSIGNIKAVFEEKDSLWQTTNGRVLLYFQKQDNFQLQYGDQIISSARLSPINGAQNPNAFDYGVYMNRKGIFDQSFIKENDWKFIRSNQTISLQSIAIKLRNRLLAILNSLEYDDESLALAAALLIGYDEYLDDDLRARFAGSGAMHILCVSGLHVGIIYMIFNFLFGFFEKIKYGNSIKTILILIIIWFYALITGLSPSVVRASTMFTFIIFGKLFNRKGNTYNSLAASALLLLLIDPNVIYNIGFQLSYSAVFAILYIQPKIFQLIYFKNIILSKIWALLGVSIAAQIGTFPLAIYYFHQFPNYFLLTNLWVIPLAFVVVSCGMLVLTIGILGLSTSIVGMIASLFLKYILLILNKGVEIINFLPNAVSENLTLDKLEVSLLYIFFFALVTHFLYKKYFWIFPLLGAALILSMSFIFNKSERLNSENWVVYKTNNFSAMDFISGEKSFLFGDSVFLSDEKEQKYILGAYHTKLGIKECIAFPLEMNDQLPSYILIQENLILFHSLRILYLDSQRKEQIYANPLPIDYIVVAKDAKVKLNELLKQYTFNYIIFDSSNSWWKIKYMKAEADNLGINYWDVNQQGAFVFSNKKPPEKFEGV